MKSLKNGNKGFFYGIIVIIFVTIVCAVLTIANKHATKSENKNNNSNSTVNSKSNSSMSFSELAYENKERLWFSFEGFTNSPSTMAVSTNLDRNKEVKTLFVTKNGYITKYNAENVGTTANIDNDSNTKKLSIKDINKYSDKEIIEKFKQLDKENFESNIKEEIYLKTSIGEDEQANTYKSMTYSAPKSGKLEILATDNGTSDQITNEKLNGIYTWKTDDYNDSEQNHKEDGTIQYPIKFKPGYFKKESFVIGIQNGNSALPTNNIVDGVNFAGFGGNFLTRIGKNQTLHFDSYKNKNVKKTTSMN